MGSNPAAPTIFQNRYETPDLVIPVGFLFQASGERALGIPLEARLDRMVAVGESRLMLSVYIVQLNVVGLQAGIDWYTSVLGFKVSKENDFLHHGTTVQLEHDQGFRLILHNAKNPARIDYPDDVQTMIVWQTRDLAGTMKQMKSKGVEFILSEPQKINIGSFVAFRDPFGNVHELIELKK